MSGENKNWKRRVPTSLKGVIGGGMMVMTGFLAGFAMWASQAPLAGAAIAPGVVIVSGRNQDIDHLEGGMVAEISVREGERVSEGQTLIVLDSTQAETERNRVQKSLVALEAQQVRARAELLGANALEFPAPLQARAIRTGGLGALDLQKSEFESRLLQHRAELGTLDEQVRAIEEEITGLEQQIAAERRKLAVIREDLKARKLLLDQGLTPRSQYNILLRDEATSEGAIGSFIAQMGQRRNAIAEVRKRQETLVAARQSEASNRANQLAGQIDDLGEQLTSRSDILSRQIIRAPVNGTVIDIYKNTIGSVVAPGETVLEILPASDDLVISARISPQDVDVVKIGQEASIRFSSLNTRTTPDVPATLEYLSADRRMDDATREPYFDARLRLSSNLPSEVSQQGIYPGMPVEAFIKTQERTFVEYLLRPVTDSFSKAFREE